MKKHNSEIKIALLAIAGILILFFGMKFLKGMNLFSDHTEYKIIFNDINGLSTSSPIYSNGFKIGTIKNIDYNFDKNSEIVVTAAIDKNMKLPEGTHAEIEADLLGNVKINLILGNYSNKIIEDNGKVFGYQSKGAMTKAADMIPMIEKMMPKIDSILGNLNVILADPSLKKTLYNVENITNSLTITATELNKLTFNLNQKVPNLMTKVDYILDNTNTVTHNLSNVDIQSTMQKIDQTINNAKEFTNKLNNNNSTLGLLMNNRQLYDDLQSVVYNADSLVIDLKQHPKRYVHFSIFGQKSK